MAVDLAPNFAPTFFERVSVAEIFSQATTQTKATKHQDTPMTDDTHGSVDERLQIIPDLQQNKEERAQQYAEEPDVASDGLTHEKQSDHPIIDEFVAIDGKESFLDSLHFTHTEFMHF